MPHGLDAACFKPEAADVSGRISRCSFEVDPKAYESAQKAILIS